MARTGTFDVVVCGSLHLDIMVHAPALPRIDETAVGSSWNEVCGGKGGNQAVQAARAGARTAMLGRIGQDGFGSKLLAHLTSADVDTSGLSVDPVLGSGMSVAILQDNGDYGAVIVSGANTAIDVRALHEHWTVLGGANVLVLQNEVPHPVNVEIAGIAHAQGAVVVLNAAPARDLGNDLLDCVDVLVVNRVEAEEMCGVAVESRASARSAITALATSSRAIVITLGGEGLVVCTTTGEIVEIEPLPVRVTSTHGAGDCFVGVLAARLSAGQDLVAASRLANAAAAAFVSRNG